MNLTLRNAALLLKTDIKELRQNLMPVIEALKEAGSLNNSNIPYAFLQAYKYGSPLANYSIYLNKLEAREFLRGFGLNYELIDFVISHQSGLIDHWELLLAASYNYLGEDIKNWDDFEKYVLNRLKVIDKNKKAKADETKANEKEIMKIIEKNLKNLQKLKTEIENTDKFHLTENHSNCKIMLRDFKMKLDELIELAEDINA